MDAIVEAYDGDIQMIDSSSVRVHQHAAGSKNTMLAGSTRGYSPTEFLESGGIEDGHEVETSWEVRRVGR